MVFLERVYSLGLHTSAQTDLNCISRKWWECKTVSLVRSCAPWDFFSVFEDTPSIRPNIFLMHWKRAVDFNESD